MATVVVEKIISVLDDDKDDEDNDDVKTLLLNPVVVSMLALPLLQIVSLPETVRDRCDTQQGDSDCKTVATRLLSAVHHYATKRRQSSYQGDALTGAPQLMPSAVSYTCDAYIHLARCLSMDHSDTVRGVADDWSSEVIMVMSLVHPSLLLTQLVASVFVCHDDPATLGSCLEVLEWICESDKTQVRIVSMYVPISHLFTNTTVCTVFMAWHRHTLLTHFIIQQSPSFEGDSKPTATEHFQSPLYGSGTVFRNISHLLRHFPSSAVARRHTSSNSVTHNYCCHAGEVTLSFVDTLIALTYLLTLRRDYYSSQLPTWSKTCSQAGRKRVESQLRTCLKRVFLHSICVAHARTSESWSKACRKPARTCRKPGCKPGRKPGFQLATIMECGLYCCLSVVLSVILRAR